MIKLHFGDAYLRPSVRDNPSDGWLNIRPQQDGGFLARDRTDLLDKVGVTDANFSEYFEHVDHPEPIADEWGPMTRIPISNCATDTILVRDVFQRMTLGEARQALIEFDRVLVPGGLLQIEVPNVELVVSGHPLRAHAIGPGRRASIFNVCGYTKDALIELCKDYGFILDSWATEGNPFPIVRFHFRKLPVWLAAWQYVGRDATGKPRPIEVPDSWHCLEIGPGRQPWPRADEYADIVDRDTARLCHKADVQNLPQEWTGRYDFVYSSHVLEHLDDPIKACSELSRIAKRGLIVCPSPMIDTLFALHEESHKWFVWPPGPSGTLRFQEIPQEYRDRVANRNMNGVAHRLYRLGPARLDHDSCIAKRWYHEAEPYLSTILWWEGKINAEIVR